MDERNIAALRKIAIMGGIDDYIAISSRELGVALDISQQCASNRIHDLLDEKLIVRDLGIRKQRIKITETGLKVLRNEYIEYRRIFELEDHIVIHGSVASGMGEGSYYICQKEYCTQFEKILGFKPFEGTLNLNIDKDDIGKIDVIRSTAGHLVNGFTSNGRSFGNVIVSKAKIRNLDCAVVVPERSHYKETLEIICQFHLRRTLGLKDGSRVDLKVEL